MASERERVQELCDAIDKLIGLCHAISSEVFQRELHKRRFGEPPDELINLMHTHPKDALGIVQNSEAEDIAKAPWLHWLVSSNGTLRAWSLQHSLVKERLKSVPAKLVDDKSEPLVNHWSVRLLKTLDCLKFCIGFPRRVDRELVIDDLVFMQPAHNWAQGIAALSMFVSDLRAIVAAMGEPEPCHESRHDERRRRAFELGLDVSNSWKQIQDTLNADYPDLKSWDSDDGSSAKAAAKAHWEAYRHEQDLPALLPRKAGRHKIRNSEN